MADPAKLDRYRPLRRLGTGGMGTVSLAADTVLGRQVALKRVTAAAGDSGLLRLRREALVGASISHPNLVSIYDVEETEDGDLVIVMEYVDGETLRDAIARDGALGTGEALRILSGAAAGLDAIHERGIVHRDVKPANVLLGRNGDVKVADLGIAAVPDRTQITTAGAMMGSLGYMAPEQMHEAPATAAIDIYALAAVAYEALSGQKARREPNPVALAYAMENKPPPDLREAWPAAPAAAAEVLERGMDRDPARRPRSAGELVSRLRAALDASPTAPLARPPARRRA
ncbi:MAG TPA: serine/threonine-protein kinase, partial [Solirubrobacteraceae bacterium]